LRAGDRLPSVREVVTQVTINPNTVHRAYRDLEHEGVVEGRPGLGTFVIASASSPVSSEDRSALLDVLRDWVIKARELGIDPEGITALFSAAVASTDPASR
jgi:GntR family transcriptional regulator